MVVGWRVGSCAGSTQQPTPEGAGFKHNDNGVHRCAVLWQSKCGARIALYTGYSGCEGARGAGRRLGCDLGQACWGRVAPAAGLGELFRVLPTTDFLFAVRFVSTGRRL